MIFEVLVVPNAGKRAMILDHAGRLKCYLKSTPEKGKANQELIVFIAQALRIASGNVSIASGLTSRKKRIVVKGTQSYQDLLKAFGLELQSVLSTDEKV
jgi:uncharacterized protein